jgi:predicted NUDIX family NTP pyrophosphohydrolase
MPKLSAGLLLYRVRRGPPEVLLVHPGGPFWKGRDDGVWSVPKGEYAVGEEPLAAALREFREELGADPPETGFPVFLGEVRQSSGKRVSAWAVAGDLDATTARSNTFTMEWPPRSGRQAEFPEIDRAEWFGLDTARDKLVRGQVAFIDRLAELLAAER